MKIETKCLRSGYEPGNGEPRQIPIIQSTTFRYTTSEEMGKLFDLESSGYFYSRLQNPTCDNVASRITAIEGGLAGMLTSSGQAANLFAVINLCNAGDHFVASSSIYGGTYNLFTVTLAKMGIECTLVDQDASDEEIQKAFKSNTKLLFAESLSNPTMKVLDIEKFAKIAHSNEVPLVIDNTFPSPVNCRPFEWGCDIVTHSTTKYIDGHGVTVGGAIVDSGNFDFSAYGDKFIGLNAPDDSYHGIVYTEKFGKAGFITKAVVQLMRDLGSCQSPQNAFYISLGLETLPLRMERYCANAEKIAKYLQAHEKVAWVKYPSLETDEYHELAKKYYPNGTCGVLCFGLYGDRTVASKMMDNLKLVRIYTHVADSHSCMLNPASHTHRQLTDEQLREVDIDPSLIRFSVGLENVDDIIADLEQAIAKA